MHNPFNGITQGEDLQRIMAKLGFASRAVVSGVWAFEGPTCLGGREVTAFVMNSARRGLPLSLMDGAWVGFYDNAQEMEMLDEATFATLAEFLFEHVAQQGEPCRKPAGGTRAALKAA